MTVELFKGIVREHLARVGKGPLEEHPLYSDGRRAALEALLVDLTLEAILETAPGPGVKLTVPVGLPRVEGGGND
jgi:hypothetical protein